MDAEVSIRNYQECCDSASAFYKLIGRLKEGKELEGDRDKLILLAGDIDDLFERMHQRVDSPFPKFESLGIISYAARNTFSPIPRNSSVSYLVRVLKEANNLEFFNPHIPALENFFQFIYDRAKTHVN